MRALSRLAAIAGLGLLAGSGMVWAQDWKQAYDEQVIDEEPIEVPYDPDPGTTPTFTCGKTGRWVCTQRWDAGTTFRSMSGTHIECGGGVPALGIPGICGDLSHSQPTTWIDIAGGLSQSCDDHSTSFYGPLSGEWNGCTSASQQSSGYQAIASVNQQGSWWPFVGGVRDTIDVDCFDSFAGPPKPPYAWYYGTTTYTVSGAFATVYDLDTCVTKQLMGTVYWPDFTVTSQIVTSTKEYKVAHIKGNTGTQCAYGTTNCDNDSLCADLKVKAVQECTFFYDNAQTRCDSWCPGGF